MFTSDVKRVQLSDVLNEIGPNSCSWSIMEFDGIGKAPNDLCMDEFERSIRSASTGFKLSCEELLSFSEGLEQTFDCLIVAVMEGEKLNSVKLSKDDFSACKIVIRAFDSAEWIVQIQE